jgi:hypothetical protein
MTPLAQSPAIDIARNSGTALRFLDRFRRHFSRLDAAMQGQSRLSGITAETLSDTGRSAEDLTGVRSHDPALPFFFQSGFGQR